MGPVRFVCVNTGPVLPVDTPPTYHVNCGFVPPFTGDAPNVTSSPLHTCAPDEETSTSGVSTGNTCTSTESKMDQPQFCDSVCRYTQWLPSLAKLEEAFWKAGPIASG